MLLTIFKTSRPPFLVLAPLCVLLAIAQAWSQHIVLESVDIVLCFLGALLAHASVNMLNEYDDYLSGLDNTTIKTPFSGGSGALQLNEAASNYVKWIAYSFVCLVFLIGAYFSIQVGVLFIIPLGMLGLLSVLFYTPQINKRPLVCLVAPGFCFAFVISFGSFIVLTDSVSVAMLILLVPLFFLVNNLLLLNQFPDVSADRAAGRNHLLIKHGKMVGFYIYCAQLFLSIIVTIYIIVISNWSIITFVIPLMMCAGIASVLGLKQFIVNHNLAEFVPKMGINVGITLFYPAAMSLSLFLH